MFPLYQSFQRFLVFLRLQGFKVANFSAALMRHPGLWERVRMRDSTHAGFNLSSPKIGENVR